MSADDAIQSLKEQLIAPKSKPSPRKQSPQLFYFAIALLIILVMGVWWLLPSAPAPAPPIPVVPSLPLDTRAPLLAVGISSSDGYVGDSIAISAIASDETQLSEVVLEIKQNNGWEIFRCASSPCEKIIIPSVEGVIEYRATAKDAAGNSASYPNTGASQLIVKKGFRETDLIPPRVTMSHSPENPHEGNTVELVVFGNDTSGIALIEIQVDGNTSKTCSFSNSKIATCTFRMDNPSLGTHTYGARAVDAFSNAKQVDAQTFTVTP